MTDLHRERLFRRAARPAARALAAAVMLTAVCSAAVMALAEDKATLGREALIGRLIPITGDPIERRSIELRIRFRVNSAELAEGAAAQLRELGAALVSQALRGAALGIYGHTDASGSADYNLALSERRAQAVAAFLRVQAGIPVERFREVRGYGEERLREELPSGAAAQRRVEIVVFHEIGAGVEKSRTEGAKTAPETDGNSSGYTAIQ